MNRPGRTKQKDKMASSQEHRKTIVIANGIAAALMFFSWFAQNIYQSEAGSVKSNIERNAQFANGEMTKALQWMLTFQTERRKEKPDPEIILNSAIGYAETVESILMAANLVDPSSTVLTGHVKEFQKLSQALQAAANKRDLPKIEEATSALMFWFRAIGPNAHEAINAKAVEVNANENKGKWVFKALFIIGSLIYGVTWWKTYFPAANKQRQAA